MKAIDSLSDDEFLALVRRAITMPDAPPQLVQQAIELWRQQQAASGAASLPQRWLAVLSFDSWASAPFAAGMRALRSEVRQMLFAAQACDIDLRIAPVAEGFALSGQLLGPETAGSIELAALGDADAGRRRVDIDAQSEFRFDGLQRGSYLITVRLGSDEIVLPPIEIGAPSAPGGA